MTQPTPVGHRLVVARHGQTAWNLEGRFQGQADPPLNETGRAQADRLGLDVAPLGPEFLVTSDLRRARETAAVVGVHCGLSPRVDPAWREVDMGAWEGLGRDDVALRYPDAYQRWIAGEDPVRPGGESEEQAGRRAMTGLRSLLAEIPAGARIMVVAHGLVLRSVLRQLAAEGSVDLDGAPPHLGNGQWCEVACGPSTA